jgi:hypothetical protein
MSTLKLLASPARGELTPAFLEGVAAVDVAKHVRDYHRTVELGPLTRLIDEAQARFSASAAEQSDGWLAPRVHATLRLTRFEAADPRLWDYLAIVAFPEYVRWRWGTPTAKARFAGSETTQALARLWWGAELTRNGEDYTPVASAFEVQDIPNTWFRLDAFHHRPAALAALRVIQLLDEEPLGNGRQVKRTKKINMLATAFNTMLTTTVLDAVVPWRGEDAEAMREWTMREADETLMLDQLPIGPSDEPVAEAEVSLAQDLILDVAINADLITVDGDISLENADPASEPTGAG